MNIQQLRDRDYQVPNNILSSDNPKLSKHTTIEELKKYWKMHFEFNSNISGFEVCASKSKGCAKACLQV